MLVRVPARRHPDRDADRRQPFPCTPRSQMAHRSLNDESIPPSVVASSPPSQASHDLRYTVTFQPATAKGAGAYELERRFGHRSLRYIQRSTNPPEAIAAYIEEF